ncbi:MAG: hypothetical protein ATN35_04080 [Epulopiscium sp. Nele67-Bin004]|nr:MAG: hypothetical protein ATN35_04080 [Epulopiscium sp. Nele67-Bin004]
MNNSLQISDIIGCEEVDLENLGVFNAFWYTDNHYFIHPNLLIYNNIPEFQNAFDKVAQQINSVFDTLVNVGFIAALQKFNYPEPSYTYIGHGNTEAHPTGKGFTSKRASDSLKYLNTLISKNPNLRTRGDIFQVIPLFQRGVGCDLISDLMFYILRQEFFAYTERVCQELGITNLKSNKDTYGKKVCFYEQQPLVFYPSELLTGISNENYVENQISINEEVRASFNEHLGNIKPTTGNIKAFARDNDDIHNKLIDILSELNEQRNVVDSIIVNIDEIRKQQAKTFKNELPTYNINKSLLENFIEACNLFRHKIENEGFAKHLYYNNKIKHENYVRYLFYLSLSWWCPDVISVREADTGRGKSDMYLITTNGSNEQLVYELKLSSNPQTIHGYEVQLPIYMDSVKCDCGVFMLVRVNTTSTCQYKKFVDKLKNKDFINPNIKCILIDGRIKPSALWSL